jgi:AcrR family transcriptional regulator
MTSPDPTTAHTPDRRTRLRAWTLEEIKAAALRQLADHGVEGLSLNAIAREPGMTGPALYRYVTSRDELLAELVVDAWEELAEAIQHAAEERSDESGAKRLGAIGLAYRAWAIAEPQRYKLAIQTPLGSGELAPDRVIPAAQRSTAVILEAIEASLLRSVTFWSRLHGLISLELDHHLASMQLAPELLYRAELAELGGDT